MKRFHALMLAAIVALTAFVALMPTVALAQSIGLPGDYSSLFQGLGQGYFSTLQYLAWKLYIALFLIEIVVIGVQGMLYKDNVYEFLQTFAFKVLMASVMLAVIANAGNIFPVIVQMFQNTAITTANAGGGTGLCGSLNAGNPTCLEGNMLLWSLQYFIAADASRAADSAEATAAGIVVFGTGLPGLSTAFLMGHENFALFCIAMGMTCVMSAAGIFLTYTLLTFETQIIMAIGVIYLAFQGSRFTAQFSQGYMSYAINIGTKFFVFYFMVAILGQITSDGDGSLAASIASLIAGAIIPFGAGSIVLVAISSPIPVICVVSSILVAAIPQFAGSLLSGSSALSASNALSSISGSLAGAGAMNANQNKQQAAGQTAQDSKQAGRDLGGHGGVGGPGAGHGGGEGLNKTQDVTHAFDHSPGGAGAGVGAPGGHDPAGAGQSSGSLLAAQPGGGHAGAGENGETPGLGERLETRAAAVGAFFAHPFGGGGSSAPSSNGGSSDAEGGAPAAAPSGVNPGAAAPAGMAAGEVAAADAVAPPGGVVDADGGQPLPPVTDPSSTPAVPADGVNPPQPTAMGADMNAPSAPAQQPAGAGGMSFTQPAAAPAAAASAGVGGLGLGPSAGSPQKPATSGSGQGTPPKAAVPPPPATAPPPAKPPSTSTPPKPAASGAPPASTSGTSGTSGTPGSPGTSADTRPAAAAHHPMTAESVQKLAETHSWGSLTTDQKTQIMENTDLKEAAQKAYASKGEAALKEFKSHETDGLMSLGSFIPKSDAPPPAVQVRISNPDKL